MSDFDKLPHDCDDDNDKLDLEGFTLESEFFIPSMVVLGDVVLYETGNALDAIYFANEYIENTELFQIEDLTIEVMRDGKFETMMDGWPIITSELFHVDLGDSEVIIGTPREIGDEDKHFILVNQMFKSGIPFFGSVFAASEACLLERCETVQCKGLDLDCAVTRVV